MEKSQHIICLAKLFCEDISLIEEIKLSISKPKQYLKDFYKDLMERGIDQESKNLSWLSFVIGLHRRHNLLELDWKSDPEDSIAICNKLLKNHPKHDEILEELSSIETYNIIDEIENFILLLNGILSSYAIQLIIIDIDSDSYLFSIIPTSNIETALYHAKSLEYGKIKYYSTLNKELQR